MRDENKNGIDDRIEKTLHAIQHGRDGVLERHPIVFGFLATFGLVATYYGIEKMIDQVPYLADRPWLIFTVGVAVLVFTGALYKKLN